MKTRVRSFTWVERVDPFNFRRNSGWLPDDAPEFDPGTAVHFAHDMVEHLYNGSDFRSELLATGATLFGRGQVAVIQTKTTGTDVANFLGQQNYYLPKISARWDKPLGDHAEAHLQMMIGAGRNESRRDSEREWGNNKWTMQLTRYEQCERNLARWLRLGFKIAKRAYKGYTPQQVDDLFDLSRGLIVQLYDDMNPQVGDKITATLNFEEKSMTIKPTSLSKGPLSQVGGGLGLFVPAARNFKILSLEGIM